MLTDNLVAYYKLDESSGNASDSVGSATLTNTSVTYGTGKINNGAVFNGSANLSSVSQAGFSLSTMTMAVWFKENTTSGTQRNLIQNTKTSNGGNVDLAIAGNGNIKATIYRSSPFLAYDLLSTGKNYYDDAWHLAIVTYDSGSLKVYVDDVEVASGSTTAITVGNFLTVGNGWIGAEDEVAIWSRALTSDERTALYNSGAGLQYPFVSTNIKSINGLAYASVKSWNGLAKSSIKNINGLS